MRFVTLLLASAALPGCDLDDDVDTGIDTAHPGVCEVADLSPGVVDVDPSCVVDEGGTFSLALEWEDPDDYWTLSQPVVGQLTDDDGDGDVDDDDTPDIVVYTCTNEVVAFSGDGSGVHWTQDGLGGAAYNVQPAIGDLDGDGLPEVVVQSIGPTRKYGVVALSGATGDVVWEADLAGTDSNPNHAAVSIADFDGDGVAEVTLGNVIFNGATGEIRGAGSGTGTGVLNCESGTTGRSPSPSSTVIPRPRSSLCTITRCVVRGSGAPCA